MNFRQKTQSSPRRKVVHIAPTPYFSNRGCHLRIDSVIACTADQADSVICTYHHGEDVPGRRIERIWKIPGYRQTTAGFSIYKFPADLFLFFLVLRTVWREKPDIIHGHLHEGAFIGWWVRVFLFWRRIPLVMDMQGSLSRELEQYGTIRYRPVIGFFRAVEALVVRMPHAFLCSSVESARLLAAEWGVRPKRITVAGDAVPEAFFSAAPEEELKDKLGLSDGERLVIYTGSLLEGKGLPYLLGAVKHFSTWERGPRFLFLGYPVDRFQSWLDQHQLASRVILTGEVPYAQLHRYLSLADLALEPKTGASGEASGKLMHYMAAALPVVCFDTPNNRDFLKDDGYFASDGSGDDFNHMIEKALADPGRVSRGRRSQQAVRQRFSRAAVAKEIMALYARLWE